MRIVTLIVIATAPFMLFSSNISAQSYVAIDLYTLTPPNGFSSVTIANTTGGPGQVVSYANAPDGQPRALSWSSPTGNVVNLQPTNLSGFTGSQTNFGNGTNQVGFAYVPAGPFNSYRHAMLWSGTADSAVDLTPTNLNGIIDSGAFGISGTQVVGVGGGPGTNSLPHALEWTSAADTTIDLQPTNIASFTSGSAAYGTDGTHQVGEGYLANGLIHAVLWSGSANTAVDLNPTNLSGYSQSSAAGISGNQQVGLGVNGSGEHAMLWRGAANTAVDLNPTNISGFSTTFAKSTNGSRQVGSGSGSATGGNDHALLWSGTANSAIDLHARLPAGFTTSNADSIDAQGNVYGEAVSLDGLHAIEWVTGGSWTGTAGASWAISGVWLGTVPGANAGTTNTDTAVFGRNATNSPLEIDAGRNIKNIVFSSASVSSVTIGAVGGQALLLTAGGTIQTTGNVVTPQTINAPLVLEGDYTISSNANSGSATISIGGLLQPASTTGITTLTLSGGNTGPNTIGGVLADNGAGKLAVTKSGNGLWILSGANAHSGNTTVLGGTLKFAITSGSPTVRAGVTASIASGATLELAGSVSALGAAGGNRVNILNDSTAPGMLISGTGQVVGGIDGIGDVQVNAGSDLTADHIIQNALIIGGAEGTPGLVAIAPSDSAGQPLNQSQLPANSSTRADSSSSNDPLAAVASFSSLTSEAASSGQPVVPLDNTLRYGVAPAVPEPSAIVLGITAAAVSLLRFLGVRHRRDANP